MISGILFAWPTLHRHKKIKMTKAKMFQKTKMTKGKMFPKRWRSLWQKEVARATYGNISLRHMYQVKENSLAKKW